MDPHTPAESASLLPRPPATTAMSAITRRIRRRFATPAFVLSCSSRTPGAVLSSVMRERKEADEEAHRRDVARWLEEGSGGAPPVPSTPSERDVRPGRIFRALEGQPTMGVVGNFRFTIGVGPGARTWIMTCPAPEPGSTEPAAIYTMKSVTRSVGRKQSTPSKPRGMSLSYHPPDEGVDAHLTYNSEKTWLRSFSGRTSDMKLMVLGKLKIGGDMSKALKLVSEGGKGGGRGGGGQVSDAARSQS